MRLKNGDWEGGAGTEARPYQGDSAPMFGCNRFVHLISEHPRDPFHPRSIPFVLSAFYLDGFMSELLTKAMRLLSGDQEGTLIVPWPPYT